MAERSEILEMTANIVAAYVGNNQVEVPELSSLIHSIHKAIDSIASGASEAPAPILSTAVSIRKSMSPDYLICLEDGKRFKSLKRHLRTKYEMSPEDYRVKWGLPKDYPMVAPNYAAARSALAKSMGLGQGGRQAAKASTKRKAAVAKA